MNVESGDGGRGRSESMGGLRRAGRSVKLDIDMYKLNMECICTNICTGLWGNTLAHHTLNPKRTDLGECKTSEIVNIAIKQYNTLQGEYKECVRWLWWKL